MKEQTESTCLFADSAQVELKQLIRRLFYDDIRFRDKSNLRRYYSTCIQCTDTKLTKVSELYIFCYTDTSHNRRIFSLSWLFTALLIQIQRLNIEKQS
ncbi:unnamed protein product [Rotaria sp. Silwood2]|nr:unnamed protein product [Rotaria sp. Silwood2]CAF3997685.1 unnamed protein product [Rotaria sp. Silwood2]